MKRIRSLLLAIFTLLLSTWLLILFFALESLSLLFYIAIGLAGLSVFFLIDGFLGKDE